MPNIYLSDYQGMYTQIQGVRFRTPCTLLIDEIELYIPFFTPSLINNAFIG